MMRGLSFISSIKAQSYHVVPVGAVPSRGQCFAVGLLQGGGRGRGDAREGRAAAGCQVEGGLPGPAVIQRSLDDHGVRTRTLWTRQCDVFS